MKRITEIGSLLSSPYQDLKARGEKELRKVIEAKGTLTATAQHLGVSLRSVQRWAHSIGIEMSRGDEGAWEAGEKVVVRRKKKKGKK